VKSWSDSEAIRMPTGAPSLTPAMLASATWILPLNELRLAMSMSGCPGQTSPPTSRRWNQLSR